VTSLSAWEIAARVSIGLPRLVVVVVSDNANVAPIVQDLRTSMEQLLEGPIAECSVNTSAELQNLVLKKLEAIVLGLDDFSEREWKSLDEARSRLDVHASLALVVRDTTIRRLSTWAPNLASWLAASLYVVDTAVEMTAAERTEQLEGFRERYGISDDEAIVRAERGEPPSAEPEFLVWLILLGRDDLVRPRNK
jgi:hypothetical protein